MATATQHPQQLPQDPQRGAGPGVVGKGGDAEPPISLDDMLAHTSAAEVDGVKFDGIDLFLFAPHVDIDSTDDDLQALADKVRGYGLTIGSVVAPVWQPTGGGSAADEGEGRTKFLEQVQKGCRDRREVARAGGPPRTGSSGSTRRSALATGRPIPRGIKSGSPRPGRKPPGSPATTAKSWPPRAKSAGAGCTPWRKMVDLLEQVGEPETVGFQADMAHTLLYTLGENAPEDRLLPDGYDWRDGSTLDAALKTLTAALRPWTIDFHVAQNDATVFGSGSHDHTGRHCQATDPNGKLDIPRHAGFWLRDENGHLTKAFKHICWDGCMFPNEVMSRPQTWNDILTAMLAVRDAHGWTE